MRQVRDLEKPKQEVTKMKYTYPPSEYMQQLLEYNALEKLAFTHTDSKAHIIATLEQRSAKKRVIADIANTIIREYVETFEKEPDILRAEDVEALESFADILIPDGGRPGKLVTDFGIYYRISKLLTDYYRKQEDWDRYAFALNRCTLGFDLLINAHAFQNQASPYFDDSLALSRQLDSDKLHGRARSKVLLTLTRVAYGGVSQFSAAKLREVNSVLLSHMEQPPTEYEEKILLSFHVSLLDYFSDYCIYARDCGLAIDLPSIRPFLMGICGGLRERLEQDRLLGMDSGQLRLNLLTCDFFLGNLTLEAMLDGLSTMQEEVWHQPSPLAQAFGLAGINSIFLTVLYKFSPLPKDEICRISRKRIQEVIPKMIAVSQMANNVYFNRFIVMFLHAASLTGSFDEFAEIILETTVYADKPLFVHTAMVREMSLAIFDYMVAATPEAFDGVAGKNMTYILQHSVEMRQLLSDCCMYHDVGKFFMLDIVGNSMRHLTEDEFRLIKEHPGHFEHIFQTVGEQDERVKCIHDCALTHHLWHDGTAGYPLIPQTKNRPFADILAIADSIDASTDFLGRPYNSGKTIDQLITEFQAQSGTKYGPEAVAALSAPSVRDRLQYLINDGRREIYYQIYAFNRLPELEKGF